MQEKAKYIFFYLTEKRDRPTKTRRCSVALCPTEISARRRNGALHADLPKAASRWHTNHTHDLNKTNLKKWFQT